MEIHAELKTNSKMFCGCKNDPFHAPKPNIYTCPVCLGLPGALPVANKRAIEWTIKLGLALDCKINLFSKFDRKHYFYPDLPKGYQISQYDLPFCYDGKIDTEHGPVRIHRIHLEEDTGKLLHKTIDDKSVSLIDFNRSSVPLVEIVTEPDIVSPEHAAVYARKLRTLLRYLDIANCDMEQGGMRLEANVSLRPNDKTTLPNYKTEIKNINSFRFLEQAIAFEIKRQAGILDSEKTVRQQTRGWNADKQATYPQRSKEDAEDYRYFPDPDIPPIRFTAEQIKLLRNKLPKLPDTLLKRWHSEYSLPHKLTAEVLTTAASGALYEKLFQTAKKLGIPANKLLKNILSKKITAPDQKSIEQTISEYQNQTQSDEVDSKQLKSMVKQILLDNPDIAIKYFQGQKQIIGFAMGQAMRRLPKNSDPVQVRAAILAELENKK